MSLPFLSLPKSPPPHSVEPVSSLSSLFPSTIVNFPPLWTPTSRLLHLLPTIAGNAEPASPPHLSHLLLLLPTTAGNAEREEGPAARNCLQEAGAPPIHLRRPLSITPCPW